MKTKDGPVDAMSAVEARFNAQQIARLSGDEIRQISACLRPHQSLLEAFGYALLD